MSLATTNSEVQSHSDYDIAEFSREFEDKRLVKSFADFLNLNEISGRQAGQSQSSIVSSELVLDQEKTIEVIKDDALQKDASTSPLTMLVHRDENREIRSIEVLCSCGKHAAIALEYDDEYDDMPAEQDDHN